MLCCIGIAFLIGVLRRGWAAVLPGERPRVLTPLPPPAYRPQPGTISTLMPSRPAASGAGNRWDTGLLTRSRTACELRFAAVGTAVYTAAVALLLMAGAADGAASTAGWLRRDALFAALAAAGLLLARHWSHGRSPLSGRERIACGLMGVGAIWLELGILDQHVFGLFAISHGSLGWDLAFHGIGTLAFVAGWALLLATTPGARRPAGSTMSSPVRAARVRLDAATRAG